MKTNVGMFSSNGMKWIANLPEGYDERTKLVSAPAGGLIVVHPDKPPLRVLSTGKVEKLDLTAKPDMKCDAKEDGRQDSAAPKTKTDRNLL